MGVVYQAHDTRLGREVALKLLRHADPASWAGFIAEAQAQARVEHDNICRVYDVGETDGEPFIVMQFIEGEPLSAARRRMNRMQLVAILERVSSAVQAAHGRGLIHCDLKPGNILVETHENGSFRPYVVDFGLAREIHHGSEQGERDWIGTPAYMAPEMTERRQTHTLDPRVDVYSLGATLFDVLAGRPPFAGKDAWQILAQLKSANAPRLRSVVKNVPVELDAIVAKCLERDPEHRYATAGALADDLRRFLDGEAIAVPRVGLVYTIRTKVRKYARKASLGIAAAGVVAALVAVVIVRRNAAVQAELARDIGRTVTEMELYMRTAHQMPPHDIERERTVVREQIKMLEGRVSEAGQSNGESVQYALGRAYLTLGDDVQACDYLQRAEAAGYASPELGYALAIAQLRAFAKLKERSEWYTADEQQKKAEIEELKARYFAPALVRLRAAEPARIEHPAYAAALVAYHEGRYADAVQKAREAFEHAPLLYEAKQLEADALYEIASQHWFDGKPDWWEQMSTAMATTLDTYAAAENITRSNPSVLQGICGARTRFMYAAFSAPSAFNPVHEYYESARNACDRSIQVDPSSIEAHVARAQMHALYALTIARADGPKDPFPAIQEAVRVGGEAIRLSAGSLTAHQTLGNALRAQAAALLARGRNAADVLERAERHYVEARATYKRDASLRDAHIYVHTLRCIDDRWRGVDMTARVARAELLIDEALAAKHMVTNALNKRGTLHIERAEQQLAWGVSPLSEFDAALDGLAKAKESNPPNTIAEKKLRVFLGKARYALATGGSAREALELVPNELKALGVEEPDSAVLAELTGLHALMEAEERLRTKGDPKTFVETARKALRIAMDRAPQKIEVALGAARVELFAVKLAISKGTATNETFDAIRAPLQLWISDAFINPDTFALMAESYALEAAWRIERKQSPEDVIVSGLALVTRALATNPKHPNALAIRGHLWLARVRATKDAEVHANAAKNAVVAFEEAFRANPLLERIHGLALVEAQRGR